jgi:hypothetical protein
MTRGVPKRVDNPSRRHRQKAAPDLRFFQG